MGAPAHRLFERGDASRLIIVDAGQGSRIDVGHAEHVVLRIKIGVENAAAPAKLKLEAHPFADLERRIGLRSALVRKWADVDLKLSQSSTHCGGQVWLYLRPSAPPASAR